MFQLVSRHVSKVVPHVHEIQTAVEGNWHEKGYEQAVICKIYILRPFPVALLNGLEFAHACCM